MRTLFILNLLVVVWVAASWVGNFMKLTECDFKSPYKCEAIHGVGIFPPVALFTAWLDIEE